MNLLSKIYEYGLLLRPVSRATVPAGYVGFRDDGKYKHGVVQSSRSLRRADVKHFDLDPLDPLDPINVRKRLDAYHEKVYQAFSYDDIYLIKMSGGQQVTLTYSARPGVEYQLTYWDENEQPTGHIDLNDFDAAVRELWGYEVRV